jgi:hypothetical protein
MPSSSARPPGAAGRPQCGRRSPHARVLKPRSPSNRPQRRSLPASSRFLLAPALRAAAAGYAAAGATRKWLYRQGLLRPTGLPCPVLSIGNLTAGGTGKTPFVEYLARHYMRVQRLPAMVLQMGRGTVDEALMLRDTFQNDPVVVAESTTSAGQAREVRRGCSGAARPRKPAGPRPLDRPRPPDHARWTTLAHPGCQLPPTPAHPALCSLRQACSTPPPPPPPKPLALTPSPLMLLASTRTACLCSTCGPTRACDWYCWTPACL